MEHPGVSVLESELSDPARLVQDPLVSVDIITYQHAPFIRAALDSVLAQKVNFPYEICLGEDGSSDGTREICREYAAKYPDRVRLFLRNRSNPARKAFKAPYMHNAAATFDACRGKYVALLEGDDFWLDAHKLQLQVAQLESDPSLAASCHYTVTLPENAPWLANIIPNVPVNSFGLDELLKREVTSVHTSTWLLRRHKSLPWKSFYTSSFGDYPIFVWTLLQGKAAMLPRVLSAYRIHGQGVFGPTSDEKRLCENVELWKCLEAIVPARSRAAFGLGLCRTLTMYIAALSKAGKYGLALAAFKQTLRELDRFAFSRTEKGQLGLLALEAVFIPWLRGLRNRWHTRCLQKQMRFAGTPAN